MAKRTSSRRKPPVRQPALRRGETRFTIFNSGLDVWLYDEANRAAIRASGALHTGAPDAEARLQSIVRDGLLAGYGLEHDDELHVSVIVGDPLTDRELSVARWLTPQHAWLRLPSGRLRIESNDTSRIGLDPPTDTGGHLSVPPGDYRLTLYRIDYRALRHEGLAWNGPQEVVVLTPGGSGADAAGGVLPFAPDSNV